MEELAGVGAGERLGEAEFDGFVAGVAVGAEEDVHEGGEVCVVSGEAFLRVVPVVEFRRADKHAQGAEREADVGMDVDGPDATEGGEGGEGGEIEAEEEGGEVDEADGVNGIERVLAVGGEPIEVLGAVMNGVEAPEEGDAVLDTMSPVDEEITEQDDPDRLEPPWLGVDEGAEIGGEDAGDPWGEHGQCAEDESAPEEVLAEEEAEIGKPRGAEEFLSFGGKEFFQRREDGEEDEKAQNGSCEEVEGIHARYSSGCLAGSWPKGSFSSASFSMIFPMSSSLMTKPDFEELIRMSHLSWTSSSVMMFSFGKSGEGAGTSSMKSLAFSGLKMGADFEEGRMMVSISSSAMEGSLSFNSTVFS